MKNAPKSSIEHLQEQMAGFNALIAIAAPFSSRARKLKADLSKIQEQMKALIETRDAFTERYSPRGWAMFDRMSGDVLHEIAELGTDEGEAVLTRYHLDPDTLRFNGQRLKREAYLPWLEIYNRAVERAAANDYTSAVPLVLIVIDGLVTRNTGRHAFSGGVDAPVFDTAASGPGGVADALRIMGQQRGSVNVAPLASPYRHGILHGVDVNFGHAQVAAKSLNILHAVIDYCDRRQDEAQRIEQARAEQTVPSISETIGLLRKVNDEKAALQAWEPRPRRRLKDGEGRRDTARFEDGTPEAAVVSYLNALTDRPNYGHLATSTSSRREDTIGVRAKYFRELLSGIVVDDWSILSIEDKAAAVCEVSVSVVGTTESRPWSYKGTIRLIYEDDDGGSVIFGHGSGRWKAIEHFLSKMAAVAFLGREVNDIA